MEEIQIALFNETINIKCALWCDEFCNNAVVLGKFYNSDTAVNQIGGN